MEPLLARVSNIIVHRAQYCSKGVGAHRPSTKEGVSVSQPLSTTLLGTSSEDERNCLKMAA